MAVKTKTPPAKTRTRKLSRKQKKNVARSTNKLPNSFVILRRALGHLWQYRMLYLGIFAAYFLLYVIFVQGLAANFQLSDTKQLLNETFEGELGTLETTAALFGALLGTAGSTSGEAASVYQMILFILFSLIIIGSLRASFDNKNKVSYRQAFYQSSYPLVQFILVGLVIILQSLPALAGLALFSVIVSNGIAVTAFEQILWFSLMVLGIGVTTYFVSSSIFASYIVTLPKMTPMNALRSARKLVKYRRFNIIRKILFLPFAALVFLAIVFLPLVFVLPLAAEILFMVCSLLAVFVLHAYFYTLYRELL